MREWPQNYRSDLNMMERICPHGVGHPDPDDIYGVYDGHGCDGCCDETIYLGNIEAEVKDAVSTIRTFYQKRDQIYNEKLQSPNRFQKNEGKENHD